MLTRRREQIVLLVGLIVLNALLLWDLNRLWHGYQERTQWIYAAVTPAPASTASAPPHAYGGTQSFGEIVNRNMFTPDRATPLPKEAAKAPELPVLVGTMNLGDGWFALIAPADQPTFSKRVQVGEEVGGGYKLVSISGSKVVVEWGEQKFDVDVADTPRRTAQNVASAPRTTEAPATARSTPAAVSTDNSRVTTVAPSSSQGGPLGSPGYAPSGAGYNAPPGAPVDAAAGTVFGGKRKVVVPTPFGTRVYWEDAEQPTGQASKNTQNKER